VWVTPSRVHSMQCSRSFRFPTGARNPSGEIERNEWSVARPTPGRDRDGQ